MKYRHRVPILPPVSAVVTPEYQAEVDRSTARAEREYQQAQTRLAAAERRAERVRKQNVPATKQRHHARELATALALVELRRAELEELARMMQSAPSTVSHRGRKSYRPIPVTHGTNL